QRLLESEGEDGRDQLLDVIRTELRARPDDPDLNIRLVAVYHSSNRLRDAVLHCQEAEKTRAVESSLEWCSCVIKTFEQRLLESEGEDGRDQLLDVIRTELRARPDDPDLNIRLVAVYHSSNRLRDAVLHCQEAEKTRAVESSLEWCSCVIKTFEVFNPILILL
ncbi:hypothetical protein ASZ78_012542, partial [Callipepla squamata]